MNEKTNMRYTRWINGELYELTGRIFDSEDFAQIAFATDTPAYYGGLKPKDGKHEHIDIVQMPSGKWAEVRLVEEDNQK